MNNELTIGKVAKQAEVNIQTLRYYDRIGLVPPSNHLSSGYRLYSPETIQRLAFIKNAQELGFTLKEVAALLKLKIDKKARASQVRKKTEQKLRVVEKKISQLQSIRKVLKNLVSSCHGDKTTDHCPILQSLEGMKK